jgi:hypothetical protein
MQPSVAARMTKHVLALAETHEVNLHWVSSWKRAEAFGHYVSIPTITRPSDYLICLHEIGLAASSAARAYEAYDHEIMREAAAWDWACSTAKPSLARALTRKDWDLVSGALGSYLKHAANHRASPKTPLGVVCHDDRSP